MLLAENRAHGVVPPEQLARVPMTRSGWVLLGLQSKCPAAGPGVSGVSKSVMRRLYALCT